MNKTGIIIVTIIATVIGSGCQGTAEVRDDGPQSTQSSQELAVQNCFSAVFNGIGPNGTLLDGGAIDAAQIRGEIEKCLNAIGIHSDGGLPHFDAGFFPPVLHFDAGFVLPPLPFDAGWIPPFPAFDGGSFAGAGSACAAQCTCPNNLRCLNPLGAVCPVSHARCIP